MSWCALGVTVAAIVMTGCGKEAAPAPQATAAPAPADNPAQPAPATPPVADAAPADAPTPAEPAKPAEPAMSKPEPDDKELERTPGLTPVLPLVKAKAPPAVEGLAGKPGESPAMGPDDAIVKVFIFSDFQCPVCRRAVEPMKKLARTFPEDVQVIFKHHALPSHSRAEPAARASLAAFRQGKFWEMHDKMFDNQQALDDATLRAQAIALGCDGAQYDKDLADSALAEQVAYESAQAQAIEAQGTPAYIINGDLTVGWGSYLGVESQVRRAIDEAKKLQNEGTPRAEVAKKATALKNEKAAKILFGQ
jgi:protein-disulfide isomerase